MKPLLLAALASALPLTASDCPSLARLSLPHTEISTAETVTDSFTPTGAAPIRNLPALCRVAGTIRPTADSDIRFEVWMPAAGWNSRFHAVGNGGFAGSLALGAMAPLVRHGYATATTDTGHQGGTAEWALHHPEKIIDYGHRGIHEMTVAAKAIITAYYGTAPRKSYFASCSNGGRQALMEAQRYPADYDGIISGAPANYFSRIAAGFLWNVQALTVPGYIPPSKLKAIEAAALNACDARDGLKDGLIDSPDRCHFDPAVLACKGAEDDSCLTAAQIGALRKIYQGPADARGRTLFPGFVPGAEAASWNPWITNTPLDKSTQYFFGTQLMRYMVVNDPAWDPKTFEVNRDSRLLDRVLGPVLNATDPNLKPFTARGGKLILFHGWCDAALPPNNTINYYNQVVRKLGARRASGSVRLYMAPGVLHCGGGPGPSQFVMNGRGQDMLQALEAWVENGTAPSSITASGGTPPRTRPLCPYPQVARYNGTGNPDDAASFTCALQKPGGKADH